MEIEIIKAVGQYILMPIVCAFVAWVLFRD